MIEPLVLTYTIGCDPVAAFETWPAGSRRGGRRSDATDVTIDFVNLGDGTTRLDIIHSGWERVGDDWMPLGSADEQKPAPAGSIEE